MIGGGGGAAIAEPVKAVGDIVDNLFTSDEERLDKENARIKLMQDWDAIQAKITTQEAAHRTVFVAGWRPFIGWICGLVVFWDYFCISVITQLTAMFGYEVTFYASGSQEVVLELILGMLGIAGLRSYEKQKGLAK